MGRLRGKRNRDQDRYHHERRRAEQSGMVGAMDVPVCVFCDTLTPSDEAVVSCSEIVCRKCGAERGLIAVVRVRGERATQYFADDGVFDGSKADRRGGPGGSATGVKLQMRMGDRAIEYSLRGVRQTGFRPGKLTVRERFQREVEKEIAYRKLHPRQKSEVPRKLTDEKAREIRERYNAGGESFGKLGREFGVTGTMVMLVVTGAVYRPAGGPLHQPRGRSGVECQL